MTTYCDKESAVWFVAPAHVEGKNSKAATRYTVWRQLPGKAAVTIQQVAEMKTRKNQQLVQAELDKFALTQPGMVAI